MKESEMRRYVRVLRLSCAGLIAVVALLLFAAGPAAAAGATASTEPAQQVTSQSAELGGDFDVPGPGYSYYFEYGTTTGYGQQTPQTPFPYAQGSVQASVSNLTLGTPYHFQAVLVAPDATQTFGGDQSFTTTVPTLPPSTMTLSANPGTVVTNQPTTLTATVSGSGGTPSGTVSFVTGPATPASPSPYAPPSTSTPISGCSAQPVSINSSGSYTATCTTIFAAGSAVNGHADLGNDVLQLGATFTPDANSTLAGSWVNGTITVNQDPVNIALVVSNSRLTVGQSGTATATVTPTVTGPYKPTGNVVFKDVLYNAAIGSCGGKTGVAVNAAGQASCTFSLDQNEVNAPDSIYAQYRYTVGAAAQNPGEQPFVGEQDSNVPRVGAGRSSDSGPSSGVGKSAGSGTVKLGKPKTSGAALRVLASCAAGGPSCVDHYQVTVTEKLHNGKVVGVTASKAKTTKVVVLGSVKVTLAAGKSTNVKLTLNAAGKKLLTKHRTLKTKLAVTTKNGTKTQTLKTAAVTFKAPKKPTG
jgi:hypothetical protein